MSDGLPSQKRSKTNTPNASIQLSSVAMLQKILKTVQGLISQDEICLKIIKESEILDCMFQGCDDHPITNDGDSMHEIVKRKYTGILIVGISRSTSCFSKWFVPTDVTNLNPGESFSCVIPLKPLTSRLRSTKCVIDFYEDNLNVHIQDGKIEMDVMIQYSTEEFGNVDDLMKERTYDTSIRVDASTFTDQLDRLSSTGDNINCKAYMRYEKNTYVLFLEARETISECKMITFRHGSESEKHHDFRQDAEQTVCEENDIIGNAERMEEIGEESHIHTNGTPLFHINFVNRSLLTLISKLESYMAHGITIYIDSRTALVNDCGEFDESATPFSVIVTPLEEGIFGYHILSYTVDES